MHGYLGGILRRSGGVAEEIGGTRDHVHILACLKATHRLSDVMREVKSSSSQWIHEVIGSPLFSWQDGYGAFTVSEAQIKTVRAYIRGQEERHRNKTYQEEYMELLRENGINFDERYLW
jgi:hypothetical protein